jgi:hypothetical protein
MIDRRDFLKDSLLAAVAGAVRATPTITAAQSVRPKVIELSVKFKGQFLYLQPTSTGSSPEAVCLKSYQAPVHDGWLFLRKENVAKASPEPQYVTDEKRSTETWYGWKIAPVEGKREVRITGLRGRPTSGGRVASGRGTRATSGDKNRHWPEDVNDEAGWGSAEWIPSLGELTAAQEEQTKNKAIIDRTKLDKETYFGVTVPEGGTFVGMKPCQVRDIIAFWKWESAIDEVLKAATDRVLYRVSTEVTDAIVIGFPGGNVTIQIPDGATAMEVYFTCAPDMNQEGPGSMYTLDDPIDHFKKFERVLSGTSASLPTPTLPAMKFLCSTRAPDGVIAGKCPQALDDRDDDIFCPGMRGPKP